MTISANYGTKCRRTECVTCKIVEICKNLINDRLRRVDSVPGILQPGPVAIANKTKMAGHRHWQLQASAIFVVSAAGLEVRALLSFPNIMKT